MANRVADGSIESPSRGSFQIEGTPDLVEAEIRRMARAFDHPYVTATWSYIKKTPVRRYVYDNKTDTFATSPPTFRIELCLELPPQ